MHFPTASKLASAALLASAAAGPIEKRAQTQFVGVNVAGCDFGCGTDGTCVVGGSTGWYCPIAQAPYYGPDGLGQMAHFASADHMNIFRLPVGWQSLTYGQANGNLNATMFNEYNTLVQGCLATGAHCIVDIHNYARFNGQIIGQGGPSNAAFASLWTSLAQKYKNNANIIFGVMNEPHDVDINAWGTTVQAAVTAIRQAGATSQIILLPGTQYTAASAYISDGSYAALSKVTNLDKSTTNLVFDVHQYLDSDNSGSQQTCVYNHSSDFTNLATTLRAAKRQALLSETGGSTDSSCITDLCAEVATLNANSDVYLGYVGWAAGSFASSYTLSLTPSGSNSTGWTDSAQVTKCLKR